MPTSSLPGKANIRIKLFTYFLTGRKPPPSLKAPVSQKKKFLAKESFHDDEDDYVDLKTDEEVEELEPSDGGWTKIQKQDGAKGLVPTDYLKESGNKGISAKCFFRHSLLFLNTTFLPEKRKPPPPIGRKKPPPPRAPKPQMKKYHANQSFHWEDDGYVDLVTDEEVEEVEPDDGGWTKIQKRNGAQGLVPTAYLSG